MLAYAQIVRIDHHMRETRRFVTPADYVQFFLLHLDPILGKFHLQCRRNDEWPTIIKDSEGLVV